MGARIKEFPRWIVNWARRPSTRKLAVWIIAIVAAFGVLGGLIAPLLVRQKLASELSKTLHREVSIQQVRINPYAMSVRVRGFLIKDRQRSGTELSFDELYVNAEFLSLFYRGLVLKQIQLVKPYINVVRNEDLSYNFTDLIEEFTKGPPAPTGPPGPPPRFSLNNIEIVDGRVDFDDRPEGVKHAITAIRIGVPFVSSLPYYTDIKVEPAFSAIVNGSPLEIGGETKPFKDSRESTLRLEIKKLQVPKYLEYSPVEVNFKVPSGQLDGKLSVSFKAAKDKAPSLAISGNLDLKELVVQEKNDAPVLSLPALAVVIDAVEVFANRASFKAVKLQGPEVHLSRNRNGTLNLASLISIPASDKTPEPKPEPKKDTTPFTFRVDEFLLEQGKLQFNDGSLERPFQKRLEDIRISAKGLTNEAEKKAETEISFHSDLKEQFNHNGTLQLAPLSVEGKIELKRLQLKPLHPYYRSIAALEARDGLFDLASNFIFAQNSKELDARLFGLQASLRSLRLDLTGESEPLWRIPLIALKDTTIDLAKRSVVIGALESRDGNGFLQRYSDGATSYARIVKPQPQPKAADKKTAPSKSQPKAPDKEAAPWTIEARRLSLDRFRMAFEDRSLATPAKILISDFSTRAEKLSTVKNALGKVSIRAKINNKGTLRLGGPVGASPVTARLDLEADGIDLLPFQSYWGDRVNLVLTGGEIGTKGNLTLEPSGDGSSKVAFKGDLQVGDFASVEKGVSGDLLRWKSLLLSGIQFSAQPLDVKISEITLSDFFSRLIIHPDGKTNLQKLVAQEKEESQVKAPSDQATPVEATPPAATAESPQRPVTIGKITLKGGGLNFSDLFIKPNYSARLTQLGGVVSELRPDVASDVELRARIEDSAPVEIRGKLNPLAKDLFLDLKVNASDIELNPMTPYSVKYVGYGIEKGKLSFEVQYRVENRKLTAENKIILNQLTFGERVESPTATKLPVLLAVALLKDRNGVIDINLPIGGSLDDPQFSVGGIVLQLVLNIITKAVTAPFTLLASVFGGGGGGGEELSYIEFDYGQAKISAAAEARLKILATALNNRPALKLEIAGRVDPINDLEGLKKAAFERKLKAQKMKELVRKKVAVKSVDEVQIESSEYGKLLSMAYREEKFEKPRNMLGLAKELPAPEMENLILKHLQVTEADVSELAKRRTEAVRNYLLSTGKVEPDRLLSASPKAVPGEEKDKAKGNASRVDFSLR
ncbi:MAG: DUF748 domain-containing protein [Deltaproteobacteria bacterium]|nr:DUF748 domain-containing protein [Deltaproteobacteria bacterium]